MAHLTSDRFDEIVAPMPTVIIYPCVIYPRPELLTPFALYSLPLRAWRNGMELEVIYRQQDGTQKKLGIRKLDDIPPIGKPIELDNRQYIAESYSGPDAEGRYRLFLEDDTDVTRH